MATPLTVVERHQHRMEGRGSSPIGSLSAAGLKRSRAVADRLSMATRRFVRRAEEWTEVARWLGVFWFCRCHYSNVASYRCYYCGKRAPAEVRTLVIDTLRAAERVEIPAPVPVSARH